MACPFLRTPDNSNIRSALVDWDDADPFAAGKELDLAGLYWLVPRVLRTSDEQEPIRE